ncbi:MAG: gliding motility-associated C-terminal domain-containing protein [Lewinellaceae bacterium]|nr:gliding motility-associated C-terminal domain-containing protein [Lewinellaceae bacterium]
MLLSGLLLLTLPIYGQSLITTFSPATTSAPIGGTVALQVRVQNFTSITSLQLPVTFNSAVLQFNSINNSSLPGFAPSNYNATAGKVTISWFPDLAQYPTGFTLTDNTAMFTMNFTVIGSGSSAVNIASVSPGIEVTRNNQVIQVNFGTGGSTVSSGGGGGPLTGFHIIANSVQIPQGQTACMPVTVNGFTNMVSASYVMHWDPTVLEYKNTQGYNLPDLGVSNFNVLPAGSNNLLMSWFDQSLMGVTRPNGATIYEVCFKGIGPTGSTSMVTINGIGFPPGGGDAEAINTLSQDVWTANSGVSDTVFVVTGAPDPTAVTFTADKDTTTVGGMTCVDIRVKNFKDIISLQFGIMYDPTKIQYKMPILFGNPPPGGPLGLSGANFNTTLPGEIKFTWFDQNALGVDLADSTIIFSVCFTALGAPGSTSPVSFVSLAGLPIEVVKEPGGEVTPTLNNGHVHITAFIAPVLQLSPTNATCNGSPTGTISASLIQGGPPTNFSWSGPSNGMTTDTVITGLMPGTYTVTVTVAGGVTSTATTTVGQPAAVSASISVNNVTCNGGQNGAITLLPAGGTSPYTFAWTGPSGYTSTAQNPTGVSAGGYTVTITDTRGCKFTSSPVISVGQPAAIQIAASTTVINPVTCFGLKNGSIALPTPVGGTPPFSYSWGGPAGFPGASSKNISTLGVGTYTLTVSDANMCTRSFTYTVDGPAAALAIVANGTPTSATCFGANNGAAGVTVSGGSTPYVVSWHLGSPAGPVIASGQTVTTLVPGSYVPQVTDNKGCTAVLSPAIAVGGPTTAITANPSVQNVLCAGTNNGSITLAPTGGNGAPFTVQWPGGVTGLQISSLAGGTYSPTVTDATGCTVAIPAISVTAPQPLVIVDTTIVQQDGLVPGSITLDMVTGGTAPLSYSWAGPGSFMAATQNISNLTFGLYTVTITDANNCTLVAQFTMPSTNILLATTVGPVTAACDADGCITFNIPSGAATPLLITMGNNTYVPTADTFKICGLTQGSYLPTISDAAGNTVTMPAIQISQLPPAIVSDSRNNPFDDFKNGSITLNPVPSNANLTYVWDDSSTSNTRMNLDSGTYIVTVTNLASGCTSVYSFPLVRQYLPFVCSIVQTTPATCLNSSNGSASIAVSGADGPTYTFQWVGSNGFTGNTQNINNLAPGVYTCTVIDESNKPHQCPIATIGSQSQLAVTNVNVLSDYNGFEVSGATVCDGSAAVVFSGQSGTTSVAWSNGVASETNNTLCGGDYAVTVTDQLGCTAVWQGELSSPPSVTGSASILSDYNGYGVSCDTYCDGEVSVSAVGGVPPYRISWPTGQVDANVPLGGTSQANQLCGGEYKVTITDKNDVVVVYTFSVSEPDPLVFEFASIAPETFTLCDGEVIASVPAGAGDLNLTWSTDAGKNGEGPRAEDLCAGELVSFVVQDQNGCTGVGQFQVPYPNDGCLQVRPVVTPGSADGKNDYTLITCIEDYPQNTFEVYNRWGQLVYQTTGYNNGSNRWEGLTPGGQLLPDGVYFFVLKFEDAGEGRQVKGYINLLR